MDDLISRQDAIRIASGYCHPANIAKELEKLPSAQPEIKCIAKITMTDEQVKEAFEKAKKAKCEIFAVQTERKKGRWIRGGSYPHHIFCSACYATYVPNDEWDIWKTDGMDCWRLPRKFCPNCGAEMQKAR